MKLMTSARVPGYPPPLEFKNMKNVAERCLDNAAIATTVDDAGSERRLPRWFRRMCRHYACTFLGIFLCLLLGLLIRGGLIAASRPSIAPPLEAVWTPRDTKALLARMVNSEATRQTAREHETASASDINGTRFSSALGRLTGMCPAECDCAYARASGIAPVDHDGQQPHRRSPSFSLERECKRMTVGQYLAKVYPTAASRFAVAPAAENARHFASLHSYYDHGCDDLGKCGTPGVMLRSLYADFL